VSGLDTSNITYSTFSITGFSDCEVCQNSLNYTTYRVIYSGCCYGETGITELAFNNSLSPQVGDTFFYQGECKEITLLTPVQVQRLNK
jgi:hypothetical protein